MTGLVFVIIDTTIKHLTCFYNALSFLQCFSPYPPLSPHPPLNPQPSGRKHNGDPLSHIPLPRHREAADLLRKQHFMRFQTQEK